MADFSVADREKIKEICARLTEHIREKNVCVFRGHKKPLFLISENYFGVWLEHVFDSVVYAETYPEEGLEIAKNTIELFLTCQKEDGQYPCYVWDGSRSHLSDKQNVGWAQIQECVSFGRLCLRVCAMLGDEKLYERCYYSLKKWVEWQKANRMRTKRGLVEMYVGYDTGHDNSGRLSGLRYPENHRFFGIERNAAVYPYFDKVAPILAVDMNCVYFGDLTALGTFADKLGRKEDSLRWKKEAEEVKRNIFRYCFDEDDCFFYDVDKKGRKRKYLSSTVLHLFQEGVLDPEKDKKVIEELFRRHIFNEKEFWTPYPFPSMAINDPSTKKHKNKNDWGYFTQGNTVLRTVLWMDKYGLSAEQDMVCAAWLKGWTACFERMPVGQELDPVTGEPSPSAPWYSSGMLFYLWSAKRSGIID